MCPLGASYFNVNRPPLKLFATPSLRFHRILVTAPGGTVLRDETQGTETEEGCVETEEAMPVALYKHLLATDKASQLYPVC